MKLSSAQIEQALSQFEAEAVPGTNSVIDQLTPANTRISWIRPVSTSSSPQAQSVRTAATVLWA